MLFIFSLLHCCSWENHYHSRWSSCTTDQLVTSLTHWIFLFGLHRTPMDSTVLLKYYLSTYFCLFVSILCLCRTWSISYLFLSPFLFHCSYSLSLSFSFSSPLPSFCVCIFLSLCRCVSFRMTSRMIPAKTFRGTCIFVRGDTCFSKFQILTLWKPVRFTNFRKNFSFLKSD